MRNLHGFDIVIPEWCNSSFGIVKGSMLAMPFPENFADVLICFNVMHHLLDYSEYVLFLKNCRAVLKPNGKLFLVEPHNNIFRKLQGVLVNLPILSSLEPLKAQRIALEEEEEELDKFMAADILQLIEGSGL